MRTIVAILTIATAICFALPAFSYEIVTDENGVEVVQYDKNEQATAGIENRMKAIREGKIINSDDEIFVGDPGFILDEIKNYENDQNPSVRLEVATIAWNIYQRNNDPIIRLKAVDQIVKVLSDSSSLVKQCGGQLLVTLSSDTFSDQAKEVIRTEMNNKPYSREVILACGIAKLEDQTPILLKIAALKSRSDIRPEYNTCSDEWAAHLALARMGNKDEISYCLKRIESFKIEDLKVPILIKCAAYIQQPEMIPPLQKYLESDECSQPISDTGVRVPYNQRILEFLPEFLKGFPIARNHVYSKENLETGRGWLRSQKKFELISIRSKVYNL